MVLVRFRACFWFELIGSGFSRFSNSFGRGLTELVPSKINFKKIISSSDVSIEYRTVTSYGFEFLKLRWISLP